MKVIDRSPKKEAGGVIDKIRERIREVMEFGLSWESDIQAQEIILTQLSKTLNNKYVMLRNIQLEGLEIPIPLVLVGPPGLFVMYTSAAKGVFRAKGESWSEMNGRTRKYEPARPNLAARTLLMSRAVEAYLTRRGQHLLEIQAVLLFTSPGTHVETIRPDLRVVQMDGLEHFISSLTQTRSFLSPEDVQKIVEALLQSAASPAKTEEDNLRQQLVQQVSSEKTLGGIQTGLSKNMTTLSNKFRLTTGQWIFLGVMAVVEIIVLIFFIIYILIVT